MVMAIRGKGLVVVAGCAHSGIINTIRYSQKITGIDQVHAVLGGFHLSGRSFEAIIDRTIEELRKIGPKVIVPMHCTGWKAIEKISKVFPDEFVRNSVGTRILL
jgi:7,8-dihydropterin-6-yl-methyl-4-(beta-D-ribofuranosyl)aminobenzene 5'-phosphate synthase